MVQVMWSIKEKLPEAFTNWLRLKVFGQQIKQGKVFPLIAEELGVDPNKLSRWLGGMGPLDQRDVDALVKKYGWQVYSLLGLEIPDKTI